MHQRKLYSAATLASSMTKFQAMSAVEHIAAALEKLPPGVEILGFSGEGASSGLPRIHISRCADDYIDRLAVVNGAEIREEYSQFNNMMYRSTEVHHVMVFELLPAGDM